MEPPLCAGRWGVRSLDIATGCACGRSLSLTSVLASRTRKEIPELQTRGVPSTSSCEGGCFSTCHGRSSGPVFLNFCQSLIHLTCQRP